MAADVEHNVAVLNGLIERTLDSVDGYRKAAESTANESFRILFEALAERRQQLTAKLQAQVRRYGSEPYEEGSVLAKAHRAFLDLKEKVTGHSDKAVIEEVERGEAFLMSKFDEVMADDYLSAEVAEIVDDAYDQISADREEIEALTHAIA